MILCLTGSNDLVKIMVFEDFMVNSIKLVIKWLVAIKWIVVCQDLCLDTARLGKSELLNLGQTVKQLGRKNLIFIWFINDFN